MITCEKVTIYTYIEITCMHFIFSNYNKFLTNSIQLLTTMANKPKLSECKLQGIDKTYTGY